MRTFLLAIAIASSAPHIDLSDLQIQRLSRVLLDIVGADEDTERGAFIVRDGSGDLELQLWPSEHLFAMARWQGVLPANVIAVLHTHPPKRPAPSAHDMNEAARTGLPFLVVTRQKLCVGEPDRSLRCANLDR